MPEKCPTPKKRAYATKRDAQAGAVTSGIALNPYFCECARWHLTMRSTTDDSYDHTEIERLLALSDDDFVSVTFQETRNALAPAAAGALRAAAVLRRWDDALKVLMASVQNSRAQVDDAQGAGAVERKKLARREQLIRMRLMETKKLKREQHEAWEYETQAAKQRNKVRRNDAGDRAIQRLIDSHPDEFRALLDEEMGKGRSAGGDAEWVE